MKTSNTNKLIQQEYSNQQKLSFTKFSIFAAFICICIVGIQFLIIPMLVLIKHYFLLLRGYFLCCFLVWDLWDMRFNKTSCYFSYLIVFFLVLSKKNKLWKNLHTWYSYAWLKRIKQLCNAITTAYKSLLILTCRDNVTTLSLCGATLLVITTSLTFRYVVSFS